MDFNQKIIFLETVFAQEVDGEIVLLDMNSENYFGLDTVGTSIWHALKKSANLNEVLMLLLDEYEVEEEILRKDLIIFVENLKTNKLIKMESQ